MLAAQWEHETGVWHPNSTQQRTTARVADVIEDCCDEYYDNWQDGPMTKKYWVQVSERLSLKNSWWKHFAPTPIQVFKIAMTYMVRWDPNGMGTTPAREMWGFQLGSLTWGKRRAQIDMDLFAKPWVCTPFTLS